MKYGERIHLNNGKEAIFLNQWKDRGTLRYMIKSATIYSVKASTVKNAQETKLKSMLKNRCSKGDRVEYTKSRGRRRQGKGRPMGLGVVVKVYQKVTTGATSNKQKPKLVWFADVIDEETGKVVEGVYESCCAVITVVETPYYWENDSENYRGGSKRLHDRVIDTGAWARSIFRNEF